MKSFIAHLGLAASVYASSFPSINVTVDGEPTTLYVHYPTWSEATVTDDSVSFDFNNRMYLSKSDTTDTSQYFTPQMLGGYVEYDVDLSGVGCGCLTALYGVLMPGLDNEDDPFKYCGAGSSAKAACPEFDIMEANKFGFRGTSHKCEPPNDNGIFSECDHRGQCTVDVLDKDNNVDMKDYGPGSEYSIDTTRLFSVRADYQESAGKWTAFTITLTQDDNQIVMSAGDCTYLQPMSWQINKGMAFVLSNWAPRQLDWVQHGTCDTECDTDNVLSTIKNMRFNTTGAKDSFVDYETYQYGDVCGDYWLAQDTNECGQACDNCHRSWPAGDSLKHNSPDVGCRCLPKQRALQGYTYGEKQCPSNTTGLCDGCDECRWSWPTDDPTKWESAEAMCRCKPESVMIDFGRNCKNAYDGLCGADCNECHWSWPQEDALKWKSEDATCRCPASDIKETVFGGNCEALNYGECGTYCRECRWSWLAEDPEKWEGESATCRCKNWW